MRQPQPSLTPALRSIKSQSGAALLLLMLVIITGASFILLSKLNTNVRQYDRQGRTALTLSDAKAALITYALTYPEKENANPEDGPGYLPCPDRTDPVSGSASMIGSAGSSCSLSGNTIIGRFPWKTLNTSDLRDHAGERLWYAVSENFKNNPKVLPYLNSDTPGTLSVDTTIDDVVAVVIAPGTPVDNQDRDQSSTSSLLDAANYLEGGNETDFEDFFSRATGEFNDQVVFITRQELMQAVEQRVLNRVRSILQDYYATHGAYPWLATFADPRADAKWLKGDVTSTSSSLIDSTADFTDWGVAAGDRVWNLTDGSYGTVNTVSATTLTLTSTGLKTGTNNTFIDGNEYLVEVKAIAAKLAGTATSGSSGLTLRDSNRDFDELTVSAGDIIDNISDGSSGMIESVLNTQITVKSLIGGSTNAFSTGNSYRIRSNTGTTSSAGSTLTDSTADFQQMGVQTGDIVRNLTLNTSGPVTTVTQHTLDVTGVSFASGNYYSVSRYDGSIDTTKGLLPVYTPGTAFDTGFQVDWSFLSTGSNTYTAPTTGSNTTYNTGLSNWTQTSSGRSGTITVANADADCNWIAATIVDCRGSYTDTNFLSGTVTGTSSGQITDSSKNFTEAGIKRGDIIENTSASKTGLVRTVSPSNTIQFVSIATSSALTFSSGEAYRIHIATTQSASITARNLTSTTPVASNTGRVYFRNTAAQIIIYNNTETGDVIESSNGVGRISGKGTCGTCNTNNRYYFDYSTLQGGSYQYLSNGNTFQIYGDYVNQRTYNFDLRFGGSSVTGTSAELRTRTVCRGYGNGCASTPSATNFSGVGTTIQLIKIDDYKYDGTLLGSANITVPSTGTPQSSIRVSGLNYQLAEADDELPAWFLKNRWHQLLYVAYADGFKPGGSGSCATGTNCLQIDGTLDMNDRQALVIAAGAQLDTATCPDTSAQDRGNGRLCDYYEHDNADDSDNLYTRDKPSGSFNDRLLNVAPDTF